VQVRSELYSGDDRRLREPIDIVCLILHKVDEGYIKNSNELPPSAEFHITHPRTPTDQFAILPTFVTNAHLNLDPVASLPSANHQTDIVFVGLFA
jgi:hypothetical protein